MSPEQTKQAICEFKEIYLSEYGILLSDKEAASKAFSLLQLTFVLTNDDEGVLL